MDKLLDPQLLLVMSLGALATYSLRAGGLLLASRLPRKGRLAAGMRALPGALMLSLVVPSIFHAGPAGMLAAGLTAAVAWRGGNTLLAMLLGMAVIFIARRLGLG